MNINETCDYIIVKVAEAGHYLNLLKLQKLLYYCQAWNMAFGRGPLFQGRFQAWVHGPVSREIYDRFAPYKALYSPVQTTDAAPAFNPLALLDADRAAIDAVLEVYGHLSGDQLEEMTHREDPWVRARVGLSPAARSENLLDEELMRTYYAARLQA